MRFIGRVTAFLSAAAMAFSAVFYAAAEVSAADSGVYYYQGKNQTAENYIAAQLEAHASQIDVYRYGMTFSELEEILSDIILSRTDIFYIEPTFQYASDNMGTVAAIRPQYYYSAGSVAKMRSEMEAAADEIISGIDKNWTPLQKALYVHDIIAVNTSYDIKNEVRSAYEVLVGKSGLCVAYAMAYKYIMDKLGIECIIVMNSDINHSWNMVRINGKWYHVDVTWDDTVPNFEGLVYHDYFMVSDTMVKSGRNPHTGTTTHSYTASDTSYDGMFWHGSAAAFIPYSKNKWYYMDSENGRLCSWDWSTSKSTIIKKIGLGWYSDSKRKNFWLYSYSRLDRSEGTIYYNTSDSIYAYDIRTGKTETVKKYSFSGSTAIYGLHIKDGKIIINTASSPTDKKFKTYAAFTLNDRSAQNKAQTSGSSQTSSKQSSSTSTSSTISTSTSSSTKLLPPKNVVCEASGTSGAVIKWDAVDGADAYSVYEYFPESGRMLHIGSTSSLKFNDKEASYGLHCYAVRAYRKVGKTTYYSKYSMVVSVHL